MDRRAFLHALGIGTISAATLDVDRLLWVPGEKTIFLPTLVRGSRFLTPSEVAYEVARIMVKNIAVAKHIYRKYDDRFAREQLLGDTVVVRLPARFA